MKGRELRNEQICRVFSLLTKGNILTMATVMRLLSDNFFVSERQIRNIIKKHKSKELKYHETNSFYKSMFDDKHQPKHLGFICQSDSYQGQLVRLV